jgi:hypothetical protein
MGIRIMYFPDVENDISNDQWMDLAISHDDHRANLHKPHGGVASNGFRMHISNVNSDECLCGDSEIHKTINERLELSEKTPYAFSISRQLLLDALAGLVDIDFNMVHFYFEAKDKPIVLAEGTGLRYAVIMPMTNPDEKPLSLPRIESK